MKQYSDLSRLFIRSWSLWHHVSAEQPPPVGGQAIIEGVMMRSKQFVSMAVRRKDSQITCQRNPYTSLTKRYRLLGWPFVRGFVQIYESLLLGLKALNFSADMAMEDEKENQGEATEKTWKDKVVGGLTILFSFAVALGFFMYLPLLISSLLGKNANPVVFNLVAGSIRIAFFLLYLWLISLWKDIRRIFEYHGAEHKAIFLYEEGLELNIENAKRFQTFHPRCGTSFLLIVALVCIFLFALVDGAIGLLVGPYPSVFHRFLAHLLMIPLVSGTSYEILKLSDKARKNPLVRLFIQPGLWLQRITTQEPDEEQLEVAFRALKAVV